jgi:hypothetical protein
MSGVPLTQKRFRKKYWDKILLQLAPALSFTCLHLTPRCATSQWVPGSIPGGFTEDFFSGSFDSSMCPGVDSASKNEYQDIPGGEGGRCVRVTTLPPS